MELPGRGDDRARAFGVAKPSVRKPGRGTGARPGNPQQERGAGHRQKGRRLARCGHRRAATLFLMPLPSHAVRPALPCPVGDPWGISRGAPGKNPFGLAALLLARATTVSTRIIVENT